MFRQSTMIAPGAVATIAASVSADTVDLDYTGIVGGTNALHARIGSSTYYAGHMSHTITSGATRASRSTPSASSSRNM